MENTSLTKQLGSSCNDSDMDSVYLVQTTAGTPSILTEVCFMDFISPSSQMPGSTSS